MKNLNKITKIITNKSLLDLDAENKELWLRAKIVLQFIYLRESKGYTQEEAAKRMGVIRQQVTRFENMTNSPTITFLVKYATALDTTIDVILKGVELVELSNKE